jgi:hypothetical protein
MSIFTNGGKIITHDNKVGTGEGCCCGEPCECTETVAAGCNIDYIAITFGFSVQACGGHDGEGVVILNAANGWFHFLRTPDAGGNLFDIVVQLYCANTHHIIQFSFTSASGPPGNQWACQRLCLGTNIIGRTFETQIPNKTLDGETCCPSSNVFFEWNGDDDGCQGAYLAITDFSIVHL